MENQRPDTNLKAVTCPTSPSEHAKFLSKVVLARAMVSMWGFLSDCSGDRVESFSLLVWEGAMPKEHAPFHSATSIHPRDSGRSYAPPVSPFGLWK